MFYINIRATTDAPNLEVAKHEPHSFINTFIIELVAGEKYIFPMSVEYSPV